MGGWGSGDVTERQVVETDFSDSSCLTVQSKTTKTHHTKKHTHVFVSISTENMSVPLPRYFRLTRMNNVFFV
jgi:hypothetical protein